MNDLWSVYILESEKDGTRYTGMTQDFARRLKEQNSKKSKFTASLTPWKLVYLEDVEGAENARKREKYFKSAAG